MSKYYVGFTFTDNLWGPGTEGEIIGQGHGRWEVYWHDGNLDHSFESDETIDDMIRGEV